MKWLKTATSMLLVVGSAACDFDELVDLEVENQNNPDRDRVLAEAKDVETLIGGAFLTWFQGTHGWADPSWEFWDAAALALSATADEGTLPWGNFGIQLLSSEPRVAWPNDATAFYRWTTEVPWDKNYEALSSVYDGLVTIGNDEGAIAAAIDVDRARAFAKFIQGLAHGFLALMFDSAFVFDETVDLEEDELLRVAYPEVMAAALGYFDEAISLASGASWSLDPDWIRGNPFSAAELVQLSHGFKARYMTQVARTPQERDVLSWAAVVREVDQNLGTDFSIPGDGGFFWWHSLQSYGQSPFMGGCCWARADYKTVGYTDTSGGYSNWLSTPVDQRLPFLILSPDRRITGDPADGTVDGTDYEYGGLPSFPEDRGTYHWSFYGHKRYEEFNNGFWEGPMMMMRNDVQQLIKAEARLRLGDADGAAAIVNVTRVGRGGLPPASGGDPDLMDKVFYESRIENHNVCSGCAFFNARGWGPLVDTRGSPVGTHHWGLVEGTPLHFPMPGAQLELLRQAIYTYGGVGNEGVGLASGTAPAAAMGERRGVPARSIYSFNGLETLSEKLAFVARNQEFASQARSRSLVRY